MVRGAMSGRFTFPREELRAPDGPRRRVNAAFLVAIEALVVAQGLIVTRLLGPELIGLYGIVTITVMTIITLKRVGIDEAYVQQGEAAQEEEFQRAFTLELVLSAAFALRSCALAPRRRGGYGDDRLLGACPRRPYLPLAFALQAPGWVFSRRMDSSASGAPGDRRS